jgi:hypothetical protein
MKVTPPRYSPHERARIYSFFTGIDGGRLPLTVEVIALLHHLVLLYMHRRYPHDSRNTIHFLRLPDSFILAHYLSSSKISSGLSGATTVHNALTIRSGQKKLLKGLRIYIL